MFTYSSTKNFQQQINSRLSVSNKGCDAFSKLAIHSVDVKQHNKSQFSSS